MRKSVIRELLKVTQDPEIISFAGGLPNPKTFPIKELEEVLDFIMENHGEQALQYFKSMIKLERYQTKSNSNIYLKRYANKRVK